MQAGTVLHWPKFTFDDGSTKNKYFVLLNDVNDTGSSTPPYIFCITTSKQKLRPYQELCQPKYSTFMIKERNQCFNEDTWLLLKELYEFSSLKIIQAKLQEGLEVYGHLSELTMQQIRNCLKDCKDDIPIRQYNIIFEKVPKVTKK